MSEKEQPKLEIPKEPELFMEEPERKGKKKGFFFLLLLTGVLFFIFWPKSKIEGDGILKAARFQQIGLTSSGILKELLHKKGDIVHEGELLARFENPELTKNHEEKKLALEILAREREILRQKKSFLEKEKQRKTLLQENGVISTKEFELTELDLSEVMEALSAKEKEAKKFETEISYLKERFESLELKAPFSGILLSDPREKIENLIREGEFVLELVDPTSFYVEATIREKEIEKIQIGEEVQIQFQAFPWQVFSGEITKIGPKTQEEVEKVFKIKHVVPCEIRLKEIPPDARYGMRARVRIRPRTVSKFKGLTRSLSLLSEGSKVGKQ